MTDFLEHVSGPPDAPLELVMYGDFQCPYCAAAQGILARVRERLEGELRFVFRHFPLEDKHPDARAAAEAAEAAGAQGRFWPMHDALYAAGGRLALDDLVRAAAAAGADGERVRAELAAGTHAPRVEHDLARGAADGVTGTPTFLVNGARHAGAFDAQALIAALRSAPPAARG